jgi:hypothetical protein
MSDELQPEPQPVRETASLRSGQAGGALVFVEPRQVFNLPAMVESMHMPVLIV